MKPFIGITAGEVQNKKRPWLPMTQGQRHTYIDAVIRAGGIPIIIPLTRDHTVIDAIYDKLDGILFAGGDDINPAVYGETHRVDNLELCDLRDEVEVPLMRKALGDQKPVFGICRGLHILNVVRGGTLYQDLPLDLPDSKGHNDSEHALDTNFIAHQLRIAENSKLATVLGVDSICANAQHHQAVKDLGEDLQAVAWAEDGVVEAVENLGDPFVMAVQPHPESLEAAVEPTWRKLFDAFVEASREWQAASQLDYELKVAVDKA